LTWEQFVALGAIISFFATALGLWSKMSKIRKDRDNDVADHIKWVAKVENDIKEANASMKRLHDRVDLIAKDCKEMREGFIKAETKLEGMCDSCTHQRETITRITKWKHEVQGELMEKMGEFLKPVIKLQVIEVINQMRNNQN